MFASRDVRTRFQGWTGAKKKSIFNVSSGGARLASAIRHRLLSRPKVSAATAQRRRNHRLLSLTTHVTYGRIGIGIGIDVVSRSADVDRSWVLCAVFRWPSARVGGRTLPGYEMQCERSLFDQSDKPLNPQSFSGILIANYCFGDVCQGVARQQSCLSPSQPRMRQLSNPLFSLAGV